MGVTSRPSDLGRDHAPLATVVIPTWNGAHLLAPCLDALRRQSLWGRFETIVVDGASTDDTTSLLARYDWVTPLVLERNGGFAANANAGIRAATGEAIALLNNDTEVDPGWLAALLKALHAGQAVGMATSKILIMADPTRLNTTGDTINIAGWPANRGAWEIDRGQWDGAVDVFGASGAAAAYRRGLLDDVGLFEEAFGSYMEDVDLAWRARLAGWECAFAADAVVRHHVSATGGGTVASFLVARNRLWLIARNYPLGLLLRHWPAVLAAQFRAAASALANWRGPAARATLWGLAIGAVSWPAMLPARWRIQSSRRIDDRALESLLAAPFANSSSERVN